MLCENVYIVHTVHSIFALIFLMCYCHW